MEDPKLLKGGALFKTPEQKAANAAAAANLRTRKLVNRSVVDLDKERITVKEAINKNKSLHEKFENSGYKQEIDYIGEPGSYKPLVNTDNGESDKSPSYLTKRNNKLTAQLAYNKYMTKVGIINGENIWYNNDKRLKEIEEKIKGLIPSRTFPNGLPSEDSASEPAPPASAPEPSTNIPNKVSQTVVSQNNSTATILAELQKQAIQLASIEKRLESKENGASKIAEIVEAVKGAVTSQMPGTASSDGKNIGKAVIIASNRDVAEAAKKAAEAAGVAVTKALNATVAANAKEQKGGRRTRKAKSRKSRKSRSTRR
jgi:hypothetical protein